MTVPKTLGILEREPILSEKAYAIMDRIVNDPKLARDFLKRAGFMDENGELAAPYRTRKE